MAEDYYQSLGVSRSASADEIQKAYRSLARQYHPDLNPDDKTAQQRFKDVQLAYDVLGDEEKRRKYDQFGPEFERAGGGNPFAGGGGGFEQAFGGGGPGGFQFDGDLGDIFRQFTGGGGGPGGGRAPRQPAKGADMSADLTVPFSTAVLGGQASINIRRSGRQETIQVKIPPGVDSGKKIRLRGQGEPAAHGAPAGDLLIAITVAPHPSYRRMGSNLELRLPISVSEAALGATVDVPTPGGVVALKIPAGSSSGRRLRIKGQGVRSTKGNAGDLFVELQLKLPERFSDPESLDAQARQAIEALDVFYDQPLREQVMW